MEYITRNIKRWKVKVEVLTSLGDGTYAYEELGYLHFDENPSHAKIVRGARSSLGLQDGQHIRYFKEAVKEKRRMELDKFMELSEKVEE